MTLYWNQHDILSIKIIMWPAEWKPSTSRKYWIRVLTIKVVLQLNSDVLQGVCTVSYWTMKPSSGTTNTIQAQAGQQNMGKHYCEQFGMRSQFHQLPVYIKLSSVYRYNVSPWFHHAPLSFPTVFADVQVAILQEHMPILCSTIIQRH